MLTGVETAGLVLAVLPLFISAFEHYNDGLEPVKAFWDIDRLLPIQIRRLRNQHVHFEQTLRILLAQIVDAEEVEDMVAAPNSDIWKTPEIQERLELLLQEAYIAYQDTISHIEEIMKMIAKDFKMDHSERANRTNLEGLLRTNTRSDGAFEFKRRVKFAASGRKVKRLLDDLDECNKELERFTDKSERLMPHRRHFKKPVTNPLNGVRTYAKALYSVLCTGTNCHISHKAKLKLERRSTPPKANRSLASGDTSEDPCFTLSLLVCQGGLDTNPSWIWQDAQIQVTTKDMTSNPLPQPLPSHPKKKVGFNLPPPIPSKKPIGLPEIDQKSLRELNDLCSIITQGQILMPCLGFCLDRGGKLRGVYPVQQQKRSIIGTVTLKDLLVAPSSASTRVKMSRKERMNIALILASSYLQLHATPWLRDTWNKEDIVFDRDDNDSSARSCNFAQPYISHRFQPLGPRNNTPQSQTASLQILTLPGNPSLLSLGILLLELYTGQTFEQYCVQASLKPGSTFDDYVQQLHNLDTVSKWLNSEQEDLSAGYYSAVLHCIRSFFDPNKNPTDENAFRQAVYEQVILPLQEDLQIFLGENRRI